jgi:hypothetical protein
MQSHPTRGRATRPPRISLPPSLLTPATLARRLEVVAGRLQSVSALARELPVRAANALDLYEATLDDIPRCRKCGCTDRHACPGGCSWVEDPEKLGELCSACVPARKAKGARNG